MDQNSSVCKAYNDGGSLGSNQQSSGDTSDLGQSTSGWFVHVPKSSEKSAEEIPPVELGQSDHDEVQCNDSLENLGSSGRPNQVGNDTESFQLQPAGAIVDSPVAVNEEERSESEPSSDRQESKSLLRDGFAASVYFLLALTILQKGLGFVRSIVICRFLEPGQLGKWGMTLAFVETVVPLLLLSIPACYGRYFEHFERKGQLRAFLRQSVAIIALIFPIGILLILFNQNSIARLVYGSSEHASLLMWSLLIIVPFGVFSIVVNMLTGLRKSKSRSMGEFINGIGFTVLAIGLLYFVSSSALMVLIAFSGAYFLASFYGLIKMRSVYRQLDRDQDDLPMLKTWRWMAPMIFVFWISDFLANFFFSVDRYMIVNYSTEKFGTTLSQVGNYEAAHVMPLLISAMTAIVAKVLLPYLSKDWENGERKQVCIKINLSIKVGAVVLLTGGMLFMAISGWLFELLFSGKYPTGQSVLPMIVYFHVCSGLCYLLLNYFWCREKGTIALWAYIAGLIVNIAVNRVLIQEYGIQGAAIGTAVAVGTQLLVLLVLAMVYGMKVDTRLLIVMLFSLLPVLPFSWMVAGTLILLALAASGLLFNAAERKLLPLSYLHW